MSPVSSKFITLKANLQHSPSTEALIDGRITSDLVNLDFCGPKLSFQGFKPLIRDHAFDCGELAIVTYLQAKIYNKPWVMLPFPVVGSAQHWGIGYNRELGGMTPKDIEGKKVGVRTYSQTMGLWIRGVLAHDYCVDLSKVTWLTADTSHLAEYKDPPNCRLLPRGSDLGKMMLDGEIVAAILGKEMPKDPRVTTLIPDAIEAGKEWIRREGLVPINHLFVVRQELSKEHPDVVREIYRMLVAGRKMAPESATAELPPYGFSAIRKTIEMAIDWAYDQKIITRRLSVDELFDETTASL
jgi:4,5-dihydroxyphthalate decarboxylase